MPLPGHQHGCLYDGANGSPPCICGGASGVADEVTQALRLLSELRRNGYRVGPIKLGSLEMRIEDLRIDDHEGLKPNEHQQRSIWADAGLVDGVPGDGTVGS